MLSQRGYHCAILEKHPACQEKTCGGLMPYKAVKLLRQIGLSPDSFQPGHYASILHYYSVWDEKENVFSYSHGKQGIGLRRVVLDSYLLDQAVSAGAEILYGCYVRDIAYLHGRVSVCGIEGRALVIACGAGGLAQPYRYRQPEGQSFGISIQVSGQTDLDPNSVYFWYPDEKENDYRWAIPIGPSLWNIGMWFQHPRATMVSEYEQAEEIIRQRYFSSWDIVRQRHGAFCGHVDMSGVLPFPHVCIGDAAGVNAATTGEGIYQAIDSAMRSIDSIQELMR